jgi:hypothetical protein
MLKRLTKDAVIAKKSEIQLSRKQRTSELRNQVPRSCLPRRGRARLRPSRGFAPLRPKRLNPQMNRRDLTRSKLWCGQRQDVSPGCV